MAYKKKTVVLVQMSMGDYRDGFVELLLESLHPHFDTTIYVGDYYFGRTTKTSEYIKNLSVRVRTINLMYKNALGIQLFNFSKAVLADVVVLEMNPRLIHTWLILFARKIVRRPTVSWGHVWARSGPGSNTEWFRAILRDSSDRLLFYTEEQKNEQLSKNSDRSLSSVFVATNSLYRRNEILAVPGASNSFIYVGRLIPEKKPMILVDAFISALDKLPADTKLHIVGTGPLESEILDKVRTHGLFERIVLHGHVGNLERLRALYSDCVASVSPGYVGLSAIQSISFGRPILVSRDEPHAPEIVALRVGFNAVFFETDDVASLGLNMAEMIEKRVEWKSAFGMIAEDCAKSYSIESMVEGFVDAIA